MCDWMLTSLLIPGINLCTLWSRDQCQHFSPSPLAPQPCSLLQTEATRSRTAQRGTVTTSIFPNAMAVAPCDLGQVMKCVLYHRGGRVEAREGAPSEVQNMGVPHLQPPLGLPSEAGGSAACGCPARPQHGRTAWPVTLLGFSEENWRNYEEFATCFGVCLIFKEQTPVAADMGRT